MGPEWVQDGYNGSRTGYILGPGRGIYWVQDGVYTGSQDGYILGPRTGIYWVPGRVYTGSGRGREEGGCGIPQPSDDRAVPPTPCRGRSSQGRGRGPSHPLRWPEGHVVVFPCLPGSPGSPAHPLHRAVREGSPESRSDRFAGTTPE